MNLLRDRINSDWFYGAFRAKRSNVELNGIYVSALHLEANINKFGLVLNNRKA